MLQIVTKCFTIPPPHHGAPHVPFWSYQPPGEGWLDALSPFTWMQTAVPRWEVAYDRRDIVHTAEDVPGDVLTAEACFRRPDGELVTVLRDSIWAQEKRDLGWPEVPCTAPVFVRPPLTTRDRLPDPVVPPGVQDPVFEPEEGSEVSFHDDGWFQTGLEVFENVVDIWQGYTQPPPTMISQLTPGPGATPVQAPNYAAVTNTGVPPGMYVDKHGHLCHRRRRRRRLLTESDFNDLMRIATLPNKQNVAVALAKAIGRR